MLQLFVDWRHFYCQWQGLEEVDVDRTRKPGLASKSLAVDLYLESEDLPFVPPPSSPVSTPQVYPTWIDHFRPVNNLFSSIINPQILATYRELATICHLGPAPIHTSADFIEAMAKKYCGTCRERGECCDGVMPTCSQCSRASLKCKGYAYRLSWPKTGDPRRSRNAKSVLRGPAQKRLVSRHLAHTTFSDIQMHCHLTALGYTRPLLQVPLPWSSSEIKLGADDLLLYFRTSASRSLTTFDHDLKALGEALMRIAFSGNTFSAIAVTNSLLALSSLHRHGVQTQAFKLKIATIKALIAATTSNLTPREVLQHAAAGMLLCRFEIHQASCTSSQWTWYISGVKEVLNAPCLEHFRRDSDLNTIMDWVYYHDVMSRFTLRHWQGDVLGSPLKPFDLYQMKLYPPMRTPLRFQSNIEQQLTDPIMRTNLELLAELNESVLARPGISIPLHQMEDYKTFIQILDWRILNMPTAHKPTSNREEIIVTELFKLATHVYLNRVSSNILNQNNIVRASLDHAFDLFSQLSCCDRQYPLFILGCEARTDEQRLVVLDLISRTEKRSSSRSMNHVKILVQALWAQDDLADGEIDYSDKLSAIISSCTIVPSLV